MTNISEKQRLINGIFFPVLFISVLWIIMFMQQLFGISFSDFGLMPRTVNGLWGILLSPLIHGGFSHLISNTMPLLLMGFIVFYFYRGIAFRVFFLVYIMTGIWVWAAGRHAYHIGASGLVYGFASFIFFSGVFRWDPRLLGLSLLVLMLYHGMIWGVLPVFEDISWESHLLGSFAGILVAYSYRKEGPKPVKYSWEESEEEETDPEQGDEMWTNDEDDTRM